MAGYCTSVRTYFHEPQANENTVQECIVFTLVFNCNVKRCKEKRLCKFTFTIMSSLPSVFAYVLACHPYILLHLLGPFLATPLGSGKWTSNDLPGPSEIHQGLGSYGPRCSYTPLSKVKVIHLVRLALRQAACKNIHRYRGILKWLVLLQLVLQDDHCQLKVKNKFKHSNGLWLRCNYKYL